MKLPLAKYRCARCDHAFDAPALPEGAYGEFLLWSKNGNSAYLNAFEDPTLKEVDNLLAACNQAKQWTPLERSKVLHHAFGHVACDPDDQGASFEIDAYPPCPQCGGPEIASWEFKDPIKIVEISVLAVTHHRWAKLSEDEKRKAVCAELR
jgi:hypothetical protein